MSNAWTVAPPATNPWDYDDLQQRALAELRLESGDPDAERILVNAQQAADIVDTWLDMVEPWATTEEIPVAVVQGTVAVTVELYRRKDAPFGILDSWSADGVVARVPADPLRMHAATMRRYKRREGIA